MNKKTVYVVKAAVIAAIYAGLTYFAAMLNVAYMGVQFRFSEALTILAAFSPAAIPGLTIGCFLGNITSPYGIVDVDLDVRILTFELLGRLLEPVRGLGLELEEIKCDLPIAGPRAASRRAQADRDRARRGTGSFQRAP